MTTRSLPRRKAPSAEALEIGRRVNQLPRSVQVRLAAIAQAAPGPHVASEDDVAVAADYIRRAMGDLLIYAAALQSSECKVARFVAYRLGADNLHNDLDAAREALVGTGREGAI